MGERLTIDTENSSIWCILFCKDLLEVGNCKQYTVLFSGCQVLVLGAFTFDHLSGNRRFA